MHDFLRRPRWSERWLHLTGPRHDASRGATQRSEVLNKMGKYYAMQGP